MKHRTALIAALSVAGVLAAGASAIAANLGILDTTDSGFGELSAVDSTSTTKSSPNVVTVFVDEPVVAGDPSTTTTAGTAPTAAGPQLLTYAVEGAGVVTLAMDGDTLTVAGVDAPGWAWEVDHDGDRVDLALRSGTRLLRFEARPVNGTVDVTVSEVAPNTGTVQPDDDSRYEDDDHGDYDDHGEDHEGWEDDD